MAHWDELYWNMTWKCLICHYVPFGTIWDCLMRADNDLTLLKWIENIRTPIYRHRKQFVHCNQWFVSLKEELSVWLIHGLWLLQILSAITVINYGWERKRKRHRNKRHREIVDLSLVVNQRDKEAEVDRVFLLGLMCHRSKYPHPGQQPRALCEECSVQGAKRSRGGVICWMELLNEAVDRDQNHHQGGTVRQPWRHMNGGTGGSIGRQEC